MRDRHNYLSAIENLEACADENFAKSEELWEQGHEYQRQADLYRKELARLEAPWEPDHEFYD